MPCLACGSWSVSVGDRMRLCDSCREDLSRSSVRRLSCGLEVRAAYLHRGTARRLVHALKYEGMPAVSGILAGAMARLCDPVDALVPIPRVLVRRIRFGIDQSRELADEVSRLTGIPVADLLVAPLWSPRHAGLTADGRQRPSFRVVKKSLPRVALIDDVVTTGATLSAAHFAVADHASYAVVATAAE